MHRQFTKKIKTVTYGPSVPYPIFISSYFITAQTAFHQCTFSFIIARFVHHCTLKQALTKREPNQQRTAGVNTANYKCVDKGETGLVSKRTGNHHKLEQLIVALSCNQIDMMR